MTNTAQRRLRLNIRGNVLASEKTISSLYPENVGALYMDSRTIPFGEVKKGGSKLAYIGAYNNSDDTLLVSFGNVPKCVTLEAFPKAIAPFNLCTLSAFFNTFDTEEWGRLSSTVTIETRPLHGTDTATSTIDLVGTVIEDFSKISADSLSIAPIALLSADSLDFGDIDGNDATVSRTLVISNTGKSPLAVRSIYPNDDDVVSVACDAKEIAPGETAEATFTVRVAAIDGLYLNERATVMTADPMHPMQTVRLVGIVKKP